MFRVVFLILGFALLRGPGALAEDPAEVVVGMSTVLTGPAANLGLDMRRGVLAGFDRANRAKTSSTLRLVALDDGYEPARTAPNMRSLIEKERVLAVIGNVGTPTAIAALPIAREQKTLFLAGFTGAGVLRTEPPDRYVINYRASYAEETGAMIDGLISRCGLKVEEIAFFTQRDGYGDAGFAGGIAALKRHGLQREQEVLHVRYERNTLAVENAVATLVYAPREPRAIIMVGAYAPCARFIILAHEAGLNSLFLNVSFVGSESLAVELVDVPAHVVVTQVVPHPLDTQVRLVREYQDDLHTFDPKATPTFGSLEGYIASRIFTQALSTISGPATREGIVDALEKLGDFDIGIGEPLKLSPDQHQACHRVWLTAFKEGAFVEFPWSHLSDLLPKVPSR